MKEMTVRATDAAKKTLSMACLSSVKERTRYDRLAGASKKGTMRDV